MSKTKPYSNVEIDVGIIACENSEGQRAKGYIKIDGKIIPGVQGFNLSADIEDITILKLTAISQAKIKAQAKLEMTQEDHDNLTHLLEHVTITRN